MRNLLIALMVVLCAGAVMADQAVYYTGSYSMTIAVTDTAPKFDTVVILTPIRQYEEASFWVKKGTPTYAGVDSLGWTKTDTGYFFLYGKIGTHYDLIDSARVLSGTAGSYGGVCSTLFQIPNRAADTTRMGARFLYNDFVVVFGNADSVNPPKTTTVPFTWRLILRQ